ncbi:DUF2179 domain-containing protein [Mycoplasmopsis lipofaciens]|uniref:DUF2179 domain-containing protein n=1 Tax=Mycoplasmopsis lipofaciens TaxID=114884 RepID=UPI000488B0A0|nr:DUF2179 domain-containing protein [Mycoplasmopsis lipofaciens]
MEEHKNNKEMQEILSTHEAFVNDENEIEEGNKKSKTRSKKKVVEKKHTHYRLTKLSNFVLKLSKFYAPMPMWKLGLITGGLAVLFGIISVFFVKNPGIYNFGLAAFGQSIARLTNVLLRNSSNITKPIYNIIDNALFWILYLFLSIPLFIFGWKKVGKVFTILTLEFLVVSSLISFGIGQIPGANDFYIIGNFDHPEFSNNLKNQIANNLWQGKNQLWSLIPIQWNDGGNIIAQILFSVTYGFMLAFFFAVIAIIGGSAGVTGIIGEYMSVVKHKNFGTINGYINIFIIFISVIVGTYLPGSLLIKDLKGISINSLTTNQAEITSFNNLINLKWKPPLYFSPNFISTFICNFVFVAFLNRLFPRFKIVQCKIYSSHMTAIRKAIVNDKKTINSFTITVGESGYSGHSTKVFSSITLYKQIPRLIKRIRSVDKNALITISNIASVDGQIYIPDDKF